MHPTAARSNRSSHQSLIPPTSATPSSLLHPQQQILYGPIANPMVTLQPYGTSLHPSCIYSAPQRNAGPANPAPLHMQGKSSRWPSKNKVPRGQQQYCQQHQQQQQRVQQQLSYNPKPLVLLDQTPSSGPPPSPTTSFLVASSTFTHGSFSGDQYNSSAVTLIPQPYFKPPEVQTFCLVQDRQGAQQQQQEQPSHGSFYNISATNTCSLQTNSSFPFPNLSPYASVTTFANNQISGPVQPVQSAQIFPNPPGGLTFAGPQREKPSSLSNFDISTYKCSNNKVPPANGPQIPPIVSETYTAWPSQPIASTSNNLFDVKSTNDDASPVSAKTSPRKVAPSVSAKTQEEHYSDESSASFDFTIEAEKMVSALCNTTSSNDLAKEETRGNRTNSAPLFSGAGDTVSNKNSWFSDFCADYGTGTSVGIQTDGPCVDRSQYPELIRKTAYWGCTKAEIVLSNNTKTDPRSDWLKNLSAATKSAITKSSTCFPLFAGDRNFVNDLINALLRVSNGWLILDNYLNKQHYPSLNDKFDRELIRCFQMWEESTHELLDQIVRTFLKLEENCEIGNDDQKSSEAPGSSFPGDVSLYTSCDVLVPSSCTGITQQQCSSSKKNDQETPFNVPQLSCGSVQNLRMCDNGQQGQACQKETKLRRHTEVGLQASSRLRAKGSATSSSKLDTSTQSLNAEFFNLRSKVLESNDHDSAKQWTFKEKKQDFVECKIPRSESAEAIFKLQRKPPATTCESAALAQNCLSRVEPPFVNPSVHLDSIYATSNNPEADLQPNYALCPPYATGYGTKDFRNLKENYENKSPNVDFVYVGKSSTNQLELSAVPKNKMTLLSQIEPSVPDKASEEMTANLSAWFASMRNSDGNRQPTVTSLGDTRTIETAVPRLPLRQEIPKPPIEPPIQWQIDSNRQLQTLRNMQSIQSAPWNACNLINNRFQVHQVPEEYDSSEDVRVYMKPGSYNVPKKRHQRRSNRRLDNSSMPRNIAVGSHRSHYSNKEKTLCIPASSTPLLRTATSSVCSSVDNGGGTTVKLPFPAIPIVPPPIFSLENSPRILKRSDTSDYVLPEDLTWKAACASAEALLEALSVKENANAFNCKKTDRGDGNGNEDNVDTNDNAFQLARTHEKSQESFSKTLKHSNDACDGMSSYEASGDDSESTYHLSPRTSVNEISQSTENKNGFGKTNVKTDSWLIRTLNNASIVSKQKRWKNHADQRSSESSNSSTIEDEQTILLPSLSNAIATTSPANTTMVNFRESTYTLDNQHACSLIRDQTGAEETDRVVGKATYSETVRRCNPLSTAYSEKKDSCKKNKLSIASASTVCSTVIPIPGRKYQRDDTERSYHLLHKLRKSYGKKAAKSCEINDPQIEEGAGSKPKIPRKELTKEAPSFAACVISKSIGASKHGKKKDNAGGCAELFDGKFGGKSSDRGWSVWYSSKRKQSLSPLALSKLEMIHQTIGQMEESAIFKQSSTDTMEEYCKIIKSPVFLETIEYKLKNRAYHKVEQAVRDFRRIVYNSKLYYKNDQDGVNAIETLSKKLEELFVEHFADWDFDNISGSPRECSPIPYRYMPSGEKAFRGMRYGNTKKSPCPSVIAENV